MPVNTGANCSKASVSYGEGRACVCSSGDGSVIEMKDSSEFYLTKNGLGTNVHLNRGSIGVEAAKQGSGHLFVDKATRSCRL